MIRVVVVGHGLAGRFFHIPLVRRQEEMILHGVVARRQEARDEAAGLWGVRTYSDLDEALADPRVDLVVLATPHDTHCELAERVLGAGKHCVVDKVMALSTAEAERMLAARDASGRMLSVFHNRRWDWDFLTVRQVLESGVLGRPLVIETAVWRYSVPRTWRGVLESAGTILHDWGAHLVDQLFQLGLGPCRRVTAWVVPSPWAGNSSGCHGRMVLEFGDVLATAETSRIARLDRARWSIIGTEGGFQKRGLDPQESALRSGDLDLAVESEELEGVLHLETPLGPVKSRVPTVRGSWDSYYMNIRDYLLRGEPLAVTGEEAAEVVRLLEAASISAVQHEPVTGHWGG